MLDSSKGYIEAEEWFKEYVSKGCHLGIASYVAIYHPFDAASI